MSRAEALNVANRKVFCKRKSSPKPATKESELSLTTQLEEIKKAILIKSRDGLRSYKYLTIRPGVNKRPQPTAKANDLIRRSHGEPCEIGTATIVDNSSSPELTTPPGD